MRIQAIEIVSEALCCINFGQSCMFLFLHHAASKNVMTLKETWNLNVTEYYPYTSLYVE